MFNKISGPLIQVFRITIKNEVFLKKMKKVEVTPIFRPRKTEWLVISIPMDDVLSSFSKYQKKHVQSILITHSTNNTFNKNNTLNDIKSFSNFSGLRPNLDKCQIAEIEVSKNVNVTLCGMKNISLTKESIKILGVHICFNKKIQDDSNLTKTIKNLCNIIKLWSLRKLNLEGKITIFKSLTISKIIHLVITRKFPDTMIEEIKQVQKNFLWDNKKV